eukprot:UN06166
MFAYFKHLSRDIGVRLQLMQPIQRLCLRRSGVSSFEYQMNEYFLQKQYKLRKEIADYNKGQKMIEDFMNDKNKNKNHNLIDAELLHCFLDFYGEFNYMDEALDIFNRNITLITVEMINTMMSFYIQNAQFSNGVQFFIKCCEDGLIDDCTQEMYENAMEIYFDCSASQILDQDMEDATTRILDQVEIETEKEIESLLDFDEAGFYPDKQDQK